MLEKSLKKKKVDKINQINQITNAGALQLQRGVMQPKTSVKFGDLLEQQVSRQQGVHFSKHAAQRVQERGIQMTDNLLQDLNNAVQKAKQKGAKDVVVIGRNGAFIVNVPNNVVVTTMSEKEMKENIFTNIDSAVLM